MNGGKVPGGSKNNKDIVSESADDNFQDDAELSEEDSFSNDNIQRLIDQNIEDKREKEENKTVARDMLH